MRAIVILGAAVRPDGAPSPTLARRIAYGAAAACEAPDAAVFCSGACGRTGPSEASVIARDLAVQGVATDRLILDEDSRDTLQTVVAACRHMRRHGLEEAIICTDGYHVPRTRMMFALLGMATRRGPVPPGHDGSRRYWLRMCLRELAAFPYDLGVVLVRRRALRAQIDAPDEVGAA